DWVPGDILDPNSLEGVFDDYDGVIHAAGILGQAGIPEGTETPAPVRATTWSASMMRLWARLSSLGEGRSVTVVPGWLTIRLML
ncbi:MAG: hypothetical protein MI702_11865, partial [Chlorobiales bacterium]|nr:hypothetical protein [Chlorobiales bacterium]